MIQRLFTCLMLMLAMQASAQTPAYNSYVDEKNSSVVFQGVITFDDLKNEKSFTWFQNGVDEYNTSSRAISYLQKLLADYDMVVLLGTWCGDSKDLMPKLYKVLQETHYPMSRYTMYGVSRAKEAKNNERTRYDLKKVPTIILFKNGKEIGRIIESVNKSIEADLKAIIKNDAEG
jgi:thiol-disulfide isomerase/thioredoxin